MNCKVISGSQQSLHLPPKPFQSTTKSILNVSPHPISFNTHLPKPSFSPKISSGSNSYKTRAKATINNLYATPQTTESFYELLGISESENLSEIKRAYKQLARKYHPDVSPPDRTEEYTRRFIRVQEAYETLSDPQTRAVYDRDLSKGFHLAFSARKRAQYDQRSDEIGEWKNRWQSQLTELKRMGMDKNSRGNNMSWGARIRMQRSEASSFS